MTGALALQNSGRRQSIKTLLPPIHPRSLFHLLWELGRYRLKLNSQYIIFWGCPLLYPKPPLILFWLLFPQPAAGTTPNSQEAAWWYQLTKKMGGICVVTAGYWGPFSGLEASQKLFSPPKIPWPWRLNTIRSFLEGVKLGSIMQVASSCNPWLLASQPIPELEMESELEREGKRWAWGRGPMGRGGGMQRGKSTPPQLGSQLFPRPAWNFYRICVGQPYLVIAG